MTGLNDDEHSNSSSRSFPNRHALQSFALLDTSFPLSTFFPRPLNGSQGGSPQNVRLEARQFLTFLGHAVQIGRGRESLSKDA